MEERFIYTVVPRRPIRNIVKGKLIVKATNLSLTKEEVLLCMKYGAVYRKFYLDSSERVTPSNLDRLHRSDKISERDYLKILEHEKKKDETIHDEKEQSSTGSEESLTEETSGDEVKEDNDNHETDGVSEAETSVEEKHENTEEYDNFSFTSDSVEEKKVEEEQSSTGSEESLTEETSGDEVKEDNDNSVEEVENEGNIPAVDQSNNQRTNNGSRKKSTKKKTKSSPNNRQQNYQTSPSEIPAVPKTEE